MQILDEILEEDSKLNLRIFVESLKKLERLAGEDKSYFRYLKFEPTAPNVACKQQHELEGDEEYHNIIQKKITVILH